jgi:hypothetical protein
MVRLPLSTFPAMDPSSGTKRFGHSHSSRTPYFNGNIIKVKVKLSLGLSNDQAMKTYGGVEVPTIINVGTRWRQVNIMEIEILNMNFLFHRLATPVHCVHIIQYVVCS